MADFRNKVLVGNIVLYPDIIKRSLIKSHYFLVFDPEKETLTLYINHNAGGQILFEIRNVSYESAVKLAHGLGLNGGDNEKSTPLVWSKWNPVLELYHDGSEDAETLRIEMLKLGIPHIVHRDYPTLGLKNGEGIHQLPMWTASKMLEIIRKTAERYRDQLATIP